MELTENSHSRTSLSDVCRSISKQVKCTEHDSPEKSSGYLKLLQAAVAGDYRSVRALIHSVENLNESMFENGVMPIHAAISSKNVWMIQELLRAGSDINLKNEKQLTPFIFAIAEGVFEVVKVLLNNGADIHTRISNQSTALHVSAMYGHMKISKLLIERGLDVDIRDEQNQTPLHVAAVAGKVEIVRLLIAKGADVSATCTVLKKKKDEREFELKLTAVGLASFYGHEDVVGTLLKAGADVNAKASENYTALLLTVEAGHPKLVNMLLKAGAGSDINLSCNGCTPLLHAVRKGHVDIVKALLKVEGIEVNPTAVTMETPLVTAAYHGHLEIAKLLVAKGAEVNGHAANMITPLHAALKHQKHDVAEFLIEHGADILATDADNITPLHVACEKNVSFNLIRTIVEKGANVDARSLKGTTPLHHAAMGGNVKTVEYLMTKASEIDAVCLLETTPLHWAAEAGHLAVVKILLKSGAKVNAQNKSECSPLHYALVEGHQETAEFLLKHNASVNLKDQIEGCTPLFLAVENNCEKLVSLLLDKGADVNAANKFGVLPIHVAVKAGNVDIAKMLLAKGAYHNVKAKADNYSGTPLKFARSAGNVKLIVILEILKKLFCAAIKNNTDELVLCVQAGAIVNARKIRGQTALHCAVNNYNCDAVKALLTGGADITLATDKGESPLQIAVANGCIKIPEVLLAHSKSLGFLKYNSVVDAKMKESGDTVLHTAAEINKLHIVKFLLASGAVYNVKNYSGKTALELTTNDTIASLLLAAEKLFEAVRKEDGAEEVKRILKVNNSVINAREVDIGGTPLYWCILKGHTAIALELLSSGADCCLVSNDGATPLHIAASKGNVEVVKALINSLKNTDAEKVKDFINAKTMNGTVALHVALTLEVAQCLLQVGATYDICNDENKTALELTHADDIRRLLKTTHQIFEDMKNGESMVLTTLNSLESAEFTAVTSTRNIHGQSLVQVALANGRIEFASKVLKKLK